MRDRDREINQILSKTRTGRAECSRRHNTYRLEIDEEIEFREGVPRIDKIKCTENEMIHKTTSFDRYVLVCELRCKQIVRSGNRSQSTLNQTSRSAFPFLLFFRISIDQHAKTISQKKKMYETITAYLEIDEKPNKKKKNQGQIERESES